MDPRTSQLLLALLRSAICGKPLNGDEKALFSQALLPELTTLAQQHDLSHLLAYALLQNDLATAETKSQLDHQVMRSLLRYERLNRELTQLCKALEAAQIPFMPLKGSVLRQYYPEPWMRTSCDIDVLVHPEDVDRATAFLMENLHYTYNMREAHDISLYTAKNFHIELHFHLIEDGQVNSASQVLKDVWQTAQLCDGWAYQYQMPDEIFYFYHIAHMAKHFGEGGCGIRTFIDLWLLDRLVSDPHKRNALLQQGELLRFAEICRMLSRVWFAEEAPNAVSQQMENYILRGGVFGSKENQVSVQQQKRGGPFKYLLFRIFMPYEYIKYEYPILQKHRWLTPLAEVHRWFRTIFNNRTRYALQELQYTNRISNDEAESTRMFLENIGLHI